MDSLEDRNSSTMEQEVCNGKEERGVESPFFFVSYKLSFSLFFFVESGKQIVRKADCNKIEGGTILSGRGSSEEDRSELKRATG
mmetsp:Transcript_35802/g.73204  ORF Transcript_35802/g.73204 Transcript_35802/m.73204 type:complete len:84 (+) Transcript_35802:3-254(+)